MNIACLYTNLILDYSATDALDHFNRVTDHAWKNSSTDVVHIQHT